jgi:hypothetical protein
MMNDNVFQPNIFVELMKREEAKCLVQSTMKLKGKRC